MRNHFYPVNLESDADEKAALAKLEHEYLTALHRYEIRQLKHIPMLADQQRAAQARIRAVELMLKAGEALPLLSTLPLVETKVRMLAAANPDLERQLHTMHRDLVWLFPKPPAE